MALLRWTDPRVQAGLGLQGFSGVWVPCSVRFLLQNGWRLEGQANVGGVELKKKMSKAMSHFALAAGQGDWGWGWSMRGDGGREYFCMLYEARRHMPSELGCLLSQGSQFDRPELAPSKDTPLIPNSHPPSYAPTTGLAITLVVYGLSSVQFCMGVYWKCRGGGTQWSEHIGHCRESRQEQLVSWREGLEEAGIRRGRGGRQCATLIMGLG